MRPERFGITGETYVHPGITLATIVAAILILALPRRQVVIPFIAGTLLIPMDQVLVIGGLHFQMLRVLVLAGWVRMVFLHARSSDKWLPARLRGIDTILWAGSILGAINTVILWQSSAAIINQLGTLYTVFGVYFFLRFVIRDTDDVLRAIGALAYVCGFVAVIMTIEQVTHHNPYSYVWAGAVDDTRTVMERDGHFRAMACFAHPLLAGTFGAICLPLFFALWFRQKKSRKAALLGMLSALVIVLAANSSTPVLAFAAGILALVLWPIRSRLRILRWSLVVGLIVLHLVMKAPVWALIARIDLTGSSSGYHRYQLVDQFIRRFGDWWLLGTKGNANWGWDMWDLANQYVAVGETSGLVPFLLFLAIIVYGFKYIGRARRAARDPGDEWFIWSLGAALFANVVAFFGISYFDQTMVCWYLLLAMIPAACASVRSASTKLPVVSPEPVIGELVPSAR